MPSIIHKIRSQPHHIRELATIICTVVVVAVVVTIWFNSFRHNIYTLLNPDQQSQTQDQEFAQESKSLFGSILQTLSDGTAQISNLLRGKSQTDVVNTPDTSSIPVIGEPHPLPVSGNR